MMQSMVQAKKKLDLMRRLVKRKYRLSSIASEPLLSRREGGHESTWTSTCTK